MATPEILLPASRQYCHNNGRGLMAGYDKKETDKIVSSLLQKIKKNKEELRHGEKVKRMNKDIKFLLSFVPRWALVVPEGLDPTFYGTLTYEGDLEVQGRVLDIINKAGCSYS